MSNDTIVDNKVVLLKYILKDDGGSVLDSSKENSPMPYLHGAQNIVNGLEKELTGRKKGDFFQVSIAPEDAYGLKSADPYRKIPRTHFPENYTFHIGETVFGDDGKGNHFPLWITQITDEFVSVTLDHPLAGKTLHFEIEVKSIRDATKEEIEHGHPHGPDGNESHSHSSENEEEENEEEENEENEEEENSKPL